MSEVEQDKLQQDELTVLKVRADKLGITYKANIGVDTLKARITAHMEDKKPSGNEGVEVADIKAKSTAALNTQAQKRKEAGALVRCRISSMDPKKKEWEGEIITVSNSVVGTFKKFIPFNVPWHVPRIMLNVLKEREFQDFVSKKVNGATVREGRMVKEFAIEILEPLTERELKDLAQRQAMANGTSA